MSEQEELDIAQVLELIDNGFTREGACVATAESHNCGPDAWEHPYTLALLNHPDVLAADDGFGPGVAITSARPS